MTGTARFPTAVAQRIDMILGTARSEFGPSDPELDLLLADLQSRAAQGGKGTRSHLVHLGWQAAGGEADAAAAVNLGAAFELLHLSALVHDDIVDGAGSRRGRSTVHVEFAQRHEREGWAGDRRRASEAAALLAGNVLMAAAQSALGDVNEGARAEWTKVQMEVNLGQFLDMVVSAQQQFDSGRVRSIMDLKTARYTAERPLRAGAAATGNATGDLLDALGRFGSLVGLAFQLRDDILGVFGDSAVTGKPVGNDLREGKATLLVVRSMELHPRTLDGPFGRMGSPEVTEADVADMQAMIESDGTLDWAERTAAEYVRQASAALVGSAVPGPVRDQLEAFARSAVERNR